MNAEIPFARIEAAPYPDRYARGWYCLGLSRHFSEEAQAIDCFGQRLVAYRGLEDFQVHVMDAFCPHMGADLSKGEVEGNNILCPFHQWSWGSSGVCEHIPYSKSIPKRAKIKAWPTLEKNGLLYVWYDVEENPPIPEQMIPEVEEYYDDDWSDWHVSEIKIHNNGRELIDNMADMGHFGPVHEAPAKSFINIVEGHTFTQVMEGDGELLENADSLSSRATYFGPAVMTTHMCSSQGGLERHSRLLVSHVPIDHENFMLRFGILVKRYKDLPRDINDYIIQQYVKGTTEAFLEDVAIWHNKVRVDNPVLCEGDGPVFKLRQWYQQFYQDIAEVSPQFETRKEYVTL